MKTAKRENRSNQSSHQSNDPLLVIFEEHLYNYNLDNLENLHLDRKSFVDWVVTDYVSYLTKHQIIIPRSLFEVIVEELSSQVRKILLKKTYGHPTIYDYQKTLPKKVRRAARLRYSKLIKAA